MPQNQINLLNPRSKSNPFSFRTRIFAFTSSVIAATMFIVWAVSAANTTIGNNITTSGNLTVSGASSLASLILSSSFNASSTLQVSATSTFYSFVGIGTTSPGALLAVQGDTLVSGNLNVANITATGTLSVARHSTLATASTTMITASNGFISSASSTVAGPLHIAGSLQASSTATLNQATMANATTTSLAVTGNASTSQLIVSNSATLNTLTGNGLFTLNSGLLSTASSTFSSNLNVSGPLNASSTLLVANLSTLSGGFVSQASSTITGNLSLSNSSPLSFTAVSTSTIPSGTHNAWSIATSTTANPILSISSTGVIQGPGGRGRVGIGTANPASQLEVMDTATSTNILITSYGSPGGFMGQFARGTPNSPSAVQLNNTLVTFGAAGFDGNDFTPIGKGVFRVKTAENWTTSANGTYLTFETTPIGSVTRAEKMRLSDAGSLGIGTTSPGALLAVQGNALFSGNLNVANITATGTVTAVNFAATGSTTLQNFTANNSTSTNATTTSLAVIGNASTSQLIVSNSATLNTLTGNGLFTLNSGLLSTASSTFSSNLNVSGPLSASSTLLVANLSTLSGGFISQASSTIIGNFIVSGGINASSTLTVAGNSIFSGTISVTGTTGTSTIGSITFSPRGAIGIGTATPNLANFEVATRTIAFNSGADGNLGSWATSANTFAARYEHSSVTANGYVYVLGGYNGSSARTNTVQYAKLNSDGTVGSWATSTNSFAARNSHSSVTANGYVYVLGGSNSSGAITNTAQYAKLNSDGSVGPWATSTNTFSARESHSSVTANGYVYVLGGWNGSARTNTVQYAKLNSDGSVGSWATSANTFAARSLHSSVAANGYVYVLGGRDGSLTVADTAQYAKLNSDGSVGSWATSTNTFAASYDHSSVTANGYVYVLGGFGSGYINTAQYAKLNSDGSVGSWATSANTFAASYDHSSVTANGYVYVLGGLDSSGAITNTAQYASTARILVSGNLDLLGLASTTLGDVNSSDFGSVGGSIFAGNIFSAGQLEVTGNANFWNGIGINGVFSLMASTSLPQDVPIFSIQNATGTSPIMTALYNGNVGIGTTTPGALLAVQGNALFSGNLNVANITATGTLNVTGVTTLTNASTTGMLTIGNGFISSASSTIMGNLNITGALRGSSTATSTMQNGINLVTGCFSINGVCVGGGGSSNWTDAGAYLTPATLSDGIIISASSTVSGNFIVSGGLNASSTLTVAGNSIFYSNVGIGTTSPGALLAVQGTGLFTNTLTAPNIIATGTLNVTGVTTLTNASTTGMLTIGNGFISQASSTISNTLQVAGNLQASSSLSVGSNLFVGGNVGIGTTSPGALLAVQGNALFSGNLNVANITATGTLSFTGTSTIGSITFSPRGAIGIGTTTPNLANFEVATRTIAFNSGADGNLGSWATSTNIFSVRQQHSSVTANGYVYVLGGIDADGTGSQIINTVQYAKLNSNGSVGPWATSTNTFTMSYSHSSVTANGYVYVLGGFSSDRLNIVQYAKLNSDGSVGPWTTSANTFASKYQHSSVTANGYVYVLGGMNNNNARTGAVQYAKLNSDGSVGPWATSTNSFAARTEHSSVAANGYVYVLGGQDGEGTQDNTTQYAKLNSDGSVGPWATSTNTLKFGGIGGRYRHSSVVANGYVYVLGGTVSGINNTVEYAKLNSNGSVGPWTTSANTFAARNYHPSVTANGYVYVLGGEDGSYSKTGTAQYASTARILVSGNLDLLGLASTTLGDVNSSDFGSVGGSIFAGNIFSAGQLEVTGNALFSNGVGINGTLSVNATTSGVQNISIFSIQNATATAPILTVLYNGNVGIGTSSPTSKLSIEGTCIDTGAGCADYAELYLSSEPVEPGDIVGLDTANPGQVKKSKSGEIEPIGAVSSNPAIIIEGSALQLMTGSNYKNNPDKPAIALAGKIPVKVNLEGGEIKVNDPITASSIAGIGKKAAKSGKIIGYALENYGNSTSTESYEIGPHKILVFASSGYWLGPDILNATSTNSSLALSQSNGLLAQVVDTVKAWLESMKVFIEDGLVRLKNLVAEKITAQKAVLDEIELKDEITRDIYCVRINNGALLTTLGECGSNIDIEPPVIALIGESVIIIEKGISWVDPGATVMDNVNDNLGIYYKVDGVETGNGGRDLPQTAIDTNVVGNYTITYTSTDSAGNIGTATRTVNIVDPAVAVSDTATTTTQF